MPQGSWFLKLIAPLDWLQYFSQFPFLKPTKYIFSMKVRNMTWKFVKRSIYFRASLLAQLVKNLPVMRKTWVWSLGWEGPLEKGKITHSSIFAWRIPWTEEPGGLHTVHEVAKSGLDWVANSSLFHLLMNYWNWL